MHSGKGFLKGIRTSCSRPERLLVLTACALFAISLLGSFCWGQGKPVKMPIQRPPSQSPAKPPEAREPKASAQDKTPPSPATPQLPASPALDLEFEMKRLEGLLQINDRNAEAYYNRGWLYAYEGDTARAIQDYSKAIELDKGMRDAYYNRGILLARAKKLDEALKDFSEFLRMEPGAADAYSNRGSVYFQMGKLDLALADFNSALKLNPNDADLLYNRALVSLAKGNKNAAMEDLKKAARMFHDRTRKEFPDLAPPVSPALKKAGLDCQVKEFTAYMPRETGQRVQQFDGLRGRLEKAFAEMERKATEVFGDTVRRQGNTLAFAIEGTDPKWTGIFGPKWPEMIRQNPKEPRLFYVSLEYAWKEECKVVQLYQACLENPDFCQETAMPNAALQVKRLNGSWQIVDGKSPEEWKKAQTLGEGFIEIVQWLSRFLTDNKGKMAREEMLITMARGYTQRIMNLSKKVAAKN